MRMVGLPGGGRSRTQHRRAAGRCMPRPHSRPASWGFITLGYPLLSCWPSISLLWSLLLSFPCAALAAVWSYLLITQSAKLLQRSWRGVHDLLRFIGFKRPFRKAQTQCWRGFPAEYMYRFPVCAYKFPVSFGVDMYRFPVFMYIIQYVHKYVLELPYVMD